MMIPGMSLTGSHVATRKTPQCCDDARNDAQQGYDESAVSGEALVFDSQKFNATWWQALIEVFAIGRVFSIKARADEAATNCLLAACTQIDRASG